MNTEKQIKNYIQRQKNWIKANNLKPGDRVLVRKTRQSESKGWDNVWNKSPKSNMDTLVGKIVTVTAVPCKNGAKYGISFDATEFLGTYAVGSWSLPYTVLQKVN